MIRLADSDERLAARAFNKQAPLFDKLYATNSIVQYKRDRVRSHVEQWLLPGSKILELNAGTGEDAVYFAGKGHHVHATDIAAGMQAVLMEKVRQAGLENLVSRELCSFNDLEQLEQKGPYDMIFSNFAGLNCTGDLKKTLTAFDSLLRPGGVATLVVMPGFCLWETMLLFKGKLKTATRRWLGSKAVTARIEGVYFKCWYYPPRYIIRHLGYRFDLLGIEGLCTLVPPSYVENFSVKHPGLYKFLVQQEGRLKERRPWRSIGDYYIISLRKKG